MEELERLPFKNNTRELNSVTNFQTNRELYNNEAERLGNDEREKIAFDFSNYKVAIDSHSSN